MVSANVSFQTALQLHQNGNFVSAEPLYREILQHEPNHVDANCLLGTLFMQVGRLEESVRYLRQAVELQPNHPVAHNNLGHALHDLGNVDAAIAEYNRALKLEPQFIEALNNLGCAFRETKRFNEASAIFKRIIALDPDYVIAYSNLGLVALDRHDYDEAIRWFSAAVDRRADYAEAWQNLGHAQREKRDYAVAIASYMEAAKQRPGDARLLCHLGVVYHLTKDYANAKRCYEQAATIDPALAEAHAGLGNLCYETQADEQAIHYYLTALSFRPDYAEPLINLGVCYQRQDKIKEAIETIEKAVRLEPNRLEARLTRGGIYFKARRFDEAENEFHWCLTCKPTCTDALLNLGSVSQARGDYSQALVWYTRVIELEPRNAMAHWNSGTTRLSMGDLARGWPEWDWGTQTKERPLAHRYALPNWGGEDLRGKTLLVYAEQGLGDEILFSSCIPDVIQSAERCIIQCDRRLEGLFRRSFPAASVRGVEREQDLSWAAEFGEIHYQCPIGSLPRYLRSTHSQFPQHHGYLVADSNRESFWRQRLNALGPGLKVGFAWRGYKMDSHRELSYTDLASWWPILTVPGVHFICLQTGAIADELAAARPMIGDGVVRFDEVDYVNDIDDCAALIASLDLVISPEMTVYNLAAALGITTWVVASNAMKRPWVTLGTPNLPWYPSVRLFRQETIGDWVPLFAQVGGKMRDLMAQTRPPALGEVNSGMVATLGGPSYESPEQGLLRNVIQPGNIVWYFGSGTPARLNQCEACVGGMGKVMVAEQQPTGGTATLPPEAQGRCDVIVLDRHVNAVSLLCRQSHLMGQLRPLIILELGVSDPHGELAGVLDALSYRIFEQASVSDDVVMAVCAPLPPVSREHPSVNYRDPLAVYGGAGQLSDRAGLLQCAVPGDESTRFFGAAILPYLRTIHALIKASGAKSLLEYGAGTLTQYATPIAFGGVLYGSVQDYWGTQDISAYEPSIAGFDTLPIGPFDGVLCADLLTRIPPQDAPWVVHELCARTQRFVFARVLSNGDVSVANADTTLRTAAWWVGLFECIASQYGIAYLVVVEQVGQTPGTPPQWYGNFALDEVARLLN